VDRAVGAAAAAFAAHRKAARHVRVGWLRAAAAAVRADAEALAGIVCADVGKPIRAARFEAGRGADFLEATAAAAAELGSEMLPLDAVAAGAGAIGMTRRMPYGVVAGITPFNAPINLLLQKVAPALAMGNAIVVKPAPAGTRVALRLAELFVAAGLPANLFVVVTGDRTAALALAAHPQVAAVTFTGGTEAGHALARAAGAKKFLAELGSNAANLVLADADIAVAARKLALAGFEASGQQCISAQRILVQRPVYPRFLERLVAAARGLKVGPAEHPETDLGPMVHEGAATRVMGLVQDALDRGGDCALAPVRDGATVSPAVLVRVPRDARLWQEEAFGPVVLVEPFDTLDEAIALANDCRFGLQAAAFTNDLSAMLRLSEDLEVGSLWINEPSRFRLDIYPFGGVKESGVGREGVRYALEELSQLKFIGLRPSTGGA
jgi:acyl-CoA reductase-like NAD-dependent aldehyde dehydrogenase